MTTTHFASTSPAFRQAFRANRAYGLEGPLEFLTLDQSSVAEFFHTEISHVDYFPCSQSYLDPLMKFDVLLLIIVGLLVVALMPMNIYLAIFYSRVKLLVYQIFLF